MAEQKVSYSLNARLSVCQTACMQAIEELGWQLMEQRDSYILTKRPSDLWRRSVTIQIMFESSSQDTTVITYSGSMFGIGPIITGAIKDTISDAQKKLEVYALSIAFGYLRVSRVTYLGGHPLMPNSTQALIGLSNENFVIHSLADMSTCSIPLLTIVKVGTGKPKTAREVYNEDRGYTIDVIEHSPFLSVAFELDKYPYIASFEAFSDATPQEWANQITAVQYQLRKRQAP